MKPTIKTDKYELYLGDCLEYMKTMLDKSVDMVITSPPYDNLRIYSGNEFHYAPIIDELYRVCKDGGITVWIVGDQTFDGSESGTSFRQALYFIDYGFNLHDTMIYEKNGASYPSQDKYYQTFEYMFIFSKGKPKTINLLCDRKIYGLVHGVKNRGAM